MADDFVLPVPPSKTKITSLSVLRVSVVIFGFSLVFQINSSQIVAEYFVGAAAIKQKFGISPVTLWRIFGTEGIASVNPHCLIDGKHAHLGGEILGKHAFVGARSLALDHPGTFIGVVP